MRVNNPVTFGILCAIVLVLLGGATYALAAGVIAPGVRAYQDARATQSPTPTVPPVTASATPFETPEPTATPEPTMIPGMTPTPVPTPVGPLYGHVIGIDSARSYSSKVQGTSTGVYANRINLAVTTRLRDTLESQGAKVVMSYTEVKTVIDDTARAKVFNDAGCEIVLRVEVNFVSASETRGALMWAPKSHGKQTDCIKLAEDVLKGYINETGMPIRQYANADIRLLDGEDFFKRVSAPVCTLIMGHISNKTDDKNLNDEAFQKKAVDGVTAGILHYFGVS